MKSLTFFIAIPFFLFAYFSIHAQITPGSENNFITVWNTLSHDFITIPTKGEGYNYDLYWVEVNNPDNYGILSDLTGNATISGLVNNRKYRIEISGDFPRIYMEESYNAWKLREISQWGNIKWASMDGAFSNCFELDVKALDAPDLTGVESLSNMFKGCEHLIGDQANWNWNTSNIKDMSGMFSLAIQFDQDISGWDVSNVTDVSYMFYGEDDWIWAPRFHQFNQNIGDWNVSNVSTMNSMFSGAIKFNQDISGWDVSKVSDMGFMFSMANKFNQDLSAWDVSKVINMAGMFFGATVFNSDISGWDVSNVTDMSGMFSGARIFNSDISGWDVSSVTAMANMFSNTLLFNQDISGWDVSNVTNMISMFGHATNFNQEIGVWNVSNVTNMMSMFNGNINFNRDISSWDVSNVTIMVSMFHGAESFNQDISRWDVSNVTKMWFMFRNAYSFNQDISSWDVGNVTNFWMMFDNAFSFNQNLGEWDIRNAENMSTMFNNSGIDCENYSATLIGWAGQPQSPNGITLGASGMQYSSSAELARNELLIAQKGWTITGDELADCGPVSTTDFEIGVSSFLVFPNPGKDHINISIPSEFQGQFEIRIQDVLGRQYGNFKEQNNEILIPSSEFPAGTYILSASGQGFHESVIWLKK